MFAFLKNIDPKLLNNSGGFVLAGGALWIIYTLLSVNVAQGFNDIKEQDARQDKAFSEVMKTNNEVLRDLTKVIEVNNQIMKNR